MSVAPQAEKGEMVAKVVAKVAAARMGEVESAAAASTVAEGMEAG